MADEKITEQTADSSPTVDDLVVIVNDPSGTPANRKVTIGDLLDLGEKPYVPIMQIDTNTDLTGGVWEQISNGTGATYTAPSAAGNTAMHLFEASTSFASDTWCGVQGYYEGFIDSTFGIWDRKNQLKALFNSKQGVDRCEVIFGIFDIDIDAAADIPFTKTKEHIAIYREGNASTTTWYASNGNGTTQTKTDISSAFTDDKYHTVRIDYDNGTDVKYYVDGTLEATHTTNMPSGTLANYISGAIGLGNTGSQVGSANTLKVVSAQWLTEV